MSISNQTDKIFGTGDGVTTVFDFQFKIFNASDLVIYEIDTTQTPNVTHGPYILNTDYTVSINAVSGGGTVTFMAAPPLAWQTLIQRVEPFTQSLVLNTEGNLPALQIGNQLDLMTMLCIQVNEAVSRCPQLPVTYSGSLPLTMPAPQAGLALAWDPTGNFLVNIAATGVGTIAVPISNGNLQQIVTAGKVSGAALISLASTPSGAGVLPIANLPTGTASGTIPVLDSNGKIAYANLESFPYVKVSEQETSGTNGGDTTGSAWTNRVLNFKDNDSASIGTLSGNQLTLPAGTYNVRARAPFINLNAFAKLRLQDITTSNVLVIGASGGAAAGGGAGGGYCFLEGQFTIATTSTIALQYYTTVTTGTGVGLGQASSIATEVYAVAEFIKVG